MSPRLQKLKGFVRHPTVQLAMGVILLLSGGAEVVYDFINAERSFHWGVHHGVALLGLVQILGSLPECIDGLERAFTATEEHRANPEE